MEVNNFIIQPVRQETVRIVPPTRLLNNPDYPAIAGDYAATFKKLKALPCDIFLAPHAEQFGLAEKLDRLDKGANPDPSIEPGDLAQIPKMPISCSLKLKRRASSR